MPIKVSDELVLYDVEELAKLFGLSEKSVRLLFKDGRLAGRKLGRKWYTTEGELQRYFSQPQPAEVLSEKQDEPAKSL